MRYVRSGIGLIVAALVLMGTTGCTMKTLRHDPTMAAAKAEVFLRNAAIDKNLAAAYALVREADRPTFSLQQLQEAVARTHPSGFPTRLEATEYEPVPGQPAMQIFLLGQSESETFYYRVPMVGTADDGYAPQGVFRGNQPYPESPLRKRLKG